MTQRPWTFLFSALILLLALFPLAWVALTNSDLPQFGRYQDEGLYVISAKTLYESGEYRIASLPGRPHQTKYQPLFSALLLPVWSGGRAFPDNLQRAAVLSIGVALAFFSVSFGLARALGFSTIAAAVLVACLATSPRLVYWTLLPIADFLFAMLILLTFWILYTKRDAPHWWWVAGGLAAAACLTKVVGALIIPAVLFANWRRKDWRRAVVVTGPAVAATLAWTIWSQQHRAGGENSVLWYYTDYVAFHVRTGGLAALPEFVYRNTFGLVEAVGGFVYYDLPSSITGRAISAALLAGAVSGARRLLRRTGAVEYVTFCVLLTMVLLTWNFNPTCRLLAPAMPLLAMALFEEARHIGGLIRQGMSSAKVGDRVVAHSFAALGVCGWIAAFTLNVQFVVVGIPGLLAIDRAALKDTLPIYEWCKRSLPPSSVVMAENDTFFHLYTQMPSLRVCPNTVSLYKQDRAAVVREYTDIDPLMDFFAVTHLVIARGDFQGYDPPERAMIVRGLMENPRHKVIYRSGGHTVLQVDRGAAGKS